MMPLGNEGLARWRSIAKGSASAFAARAIAIGCAFVQVPIALRFLGTEAFGVWAMSQALAGFAAMLDLGMGYHLQNAASAANATARFEHLASVLRSACWISVGMALLAGGVGCMIGGETWARLLGLQSPGLRTDCIRWAWLIVAIAATGIPLGLGARLATGIQKSWLAGATQAAASFLTLLLVVGCAWLDAPAIVFLVVATALPVAVNGVLSVVMVRNLSLASALRAMPTREALRRDLGNGLFYLVPQLSAALRQTGPALIIAGTLGATAVTPFNLVQRLFNLLAQPQLWVMEPLWAAYADARARHDAAWIRHTFRITLLASALLAAVPLLSAYLWGGRFLEWWTRHPANEFPSQLLLWVAVWYATTALIQPISYLLNGLGRMRGQVLYGSLTTAAALAAMVPISRAGGLGIACLPLAAAVLAVNLPGAILDVRGALRTLPDTPSK